MATCFNVPRHHSEGTTNCKICSYRSNLLATFRLSKWYLMTHNTYSFWGGCIFLGAQKSFCLVAQHLHPLTLALSRGVILVLWPSSHILLVAMKGMELPKMAASACTKPTCQLCLLYSHYNLSLIYIYTYIDISLSLSDYLHVLLVLMLLT